MRAEDFVVKGIFFKPKSPSKDLGKVLVEVKDMLIEYAKSKGLVSITPEFFTSRHRYLEVNFLHKIHFEFSEKKEKHMKKYFEYLKSVRDDYPWKVTIHLYPARFEESEGIFVEITSEPAIFYKIAQMEIKPPIEEEKYSFIIYTNKMFVNSIAKSIGCVPVKEPEPLGKTKTEVSEKLKTFGFDKVASLIEKGWKKIEQGETEYGLDDLRSAIENFLFDLVKKLGGDPHSLDKPEKNIELLESMGYLGGRIKGLITTIMYNKIYTILSDETIHKRKSTDLFDARLYFNLTEQIFDYLLEKIVRYKIKQVKQNAALH